MKKFAACISLLLFTTKLCFGAVGGSVGVAPTPHPLAFSEAGTAAIPLTIPTPDQDSGEVYKSITHPDVYYNPAGVFGKRYWMVFTPYPDEARENPCIVSGNDGVNWAVPSGLSNPIAPAAEAVSGFHADGDILLLTNGQLAVFYMYFTNSGTGTQLRKRVSNNGVNWGNYTSPLTLTHDFDEYGIVSPAIVNEGDGTYTMFYVKRNIRASLSVSTITRVGTTATATTASAHNYSNGDKVKISGANQEPYNGVFTITVTGGSTFTYTITIDPGANATGTLLSTWPSEDRIRYRTSSDNGDTWSAETTCTYSVDRMYNPAPWHLDVAKVGDKYNFLVMADEGRLYYGWSTNKTAINFQPSFQPAIPVSGYPFDRASSGAIHYRSCLVATDLERFDVYVTGLPIGAATSGAWPAGNPWRVGLYKNIRLPHGLNGTLVDGYVMPVAAAMSFTPSAVWPSADFGIFHRFTLDQYTKVRYIRWFQGSVASGFVEAGLGRLSGSNGDTFTPIYSTGRIACPTADTEVKKDMGATVLAPGNYAVYLWCDNTTARFYQGYVDGFRYSRFNSQLLLGTNGPNALLRTTYALEPNTGRVVTGLGLQGDF